MPILPRIRDGFIIIPLATFVVWYAVWYMFCILSARSVGSVVINMFGNIPEFTIVTVVAAVAVFAWIILVQWSRFQQHIKSNIGSSEAKQDASRHFALIPYLIIPVIFGALAVIAGLYCADYLASHNVAVGAQEIGGLAVGCSVIIYAVLDKFLVRNLGNATYFETLEDEAIKSADSALEGISAEDLKLLQAVKQLKK